MSIYQKRIEKAVKIMARQNLDVLILINPANMFYLTGDGRLCAYAMVTINGDVAIGAPQTDIEDIKQKARFDHVAGFENEVGMIHSIADCFKMFGINKGKLGVEYGFLPKPRLEMITHPHAKPENVEVKDCTALMSELRIVKDDEEIKRLEAAGKVADIGMKAALENLKPGMTESQIAAEAEYAMRQAGAVDFYKTYVASGPRTNLAHGIPSLRKAQPGDLIMIDIHPVVNGYTVDMCRTVCLGKAGSEQQAAYDLYVKALETTIEKGVAGITIMELEQTMHDMFKSAGHQDHIFGPPIHGIGIQFEESPLPAGHAFFHGEPPPPPLSSGVSIAIGNCGLYTGPWAVREEDSIVIGKNKPQILTRFPRQLEIPG